MRRREFEEAEQLLGTCRSLEPDNAETEFVAGQLRMAQGRHEEAIEHIERSRTIGADTPAALSNLGCSLHALGRNREALWMLRRALALDSGFHDALTNLGVVLLELGRLDEALEASTRATTADPASAEAAHNRGAVLAALGRWDEACEWYDSARDLNPRMAQAYIGKGNALRMQGLCEEAAETIMKGIEIEPNRPDAWYNLSACLGAADRHMEVLEAGWRALQIDPSFAPAYTAVGSALRNIRPHEVALKFYEMALAHDAENIDALKHIAAEYDIENRLEQALDAHLRVLEVDPADSLSPSRVVDITLALCDWRHYDSFSANLLDATQRQIAGGRAVTADITNLLALPVTNELTFAAARNKAAHIERGQKSVKTRPFTFSRRARDKIRIAYLLPYTWFHSMPLVLKQVVERHDRDRFSVRGYSIQTTRETADKSGFDHSFRPAFDVFRDSPRSSPGWAAHRIHDDETDIAIDTTGHTATNCLPIMAQRPAPVQAHYLGYGMTSGADFIDYLITDAVFMPPEMARYCTEKLVHLPHTFLATVRAPIQETAVRREEFGLPADGFVFCNFGRPNKLEPTVFAAWMRILRAVEGAVLWLGDWVPPTQRNLRREAAAEGVDPERLIFSGIVSHPLHLKRLALADLALDTFHHGGGVTTVDSLWAGLPVLTLAGETPPSRLGTTLLSAAEMPELITRRGEDYEALAVSLATNADRARSLRGRLWRQRLTCPLFDTDRYVRHLEHGLSLMWESHLRR